MNAPSWLWWLVGLLVLLAVLYLVGIRVNVSASAPPVFALIG
jgi:hypothetical protein